MSVCLCLSVWLAGCMSVCMYVCLHLVSTYTPVHMLFDNDYFRNYNLKKNNGSYTIFNRHFF